MIVRGAAEAVVFPVSSCVVPEGLDGPGKSTSHNERQLTIVHIFVTSSETPLNADSVTQDAAAIIAGESLYS